MRWANTHLGYRCCSPWRRCALRLRPARDCHDLASADLGDRTGNRAGLVFSGMGRAERPRFCLRGSTDNIREWRTGRWHPYGHRLLPRFPAGDLQLYSRAHWPPYRSGSDRPTGGGDAELPSGPVGSQLGVRLSRGGFQFRTQYFRYLDDVTAGGTGISTHLNLSRSALILENGVRPICPARCFTPGLTARAAVSPLLPGSRPWLSARQA